MDHIMLNLFPLIIATAIMPFSIIVTLQLLRSESGIGKATAFIGAILFVRLIQGVIFGLLIRNAEAGESAEIRSLVTGSLTLVLALLLIVSGIRLLLKENDPGESLKLADEPGQMSAPKAAAAGLALIALSPRQWVFMLSSLAIISEHEPGRIAGISSYLIYAIGATALLLIPYIASLTIPAQSAARMRATGAWLERNDRWVGIGVAVVFGSHFLANALHSFLD